MASATPPDIPAPKINDRDYMRLWHMYIDRDIEKRDLEIRYSRLRSAFYVTAGFLAFTAVFIAVILFSYYLHVTLCQG